jgi:threonylcarbamoyladenosine tRNA methylthiotransferase MtaB
MKYALVTFGCRVNQADSLEIEDGLRRRGAVAVPPEAADVVVVNTCSVTSSADQAVRQTIRRIAHANPGARIVVTGCYATRDAESVSALPNVVSVVNNGQKETLAAMVAGPIGTDTADRYGHGDGPCGSTLVPGVAGRTAFTLRVQTGCEERCSYCIIPATRGASRSKPIARVLHEVGMAIRAGYKEIVLTGVHLGSYGRDLETRATLATLLATLADVQDDVLFRVSSLEPMDCSTDVVGAIAASPRFASHFHLPLQHGADEILRAMRRPYSVAYYEGLTERIKTRLPQASIGSDVIVGFPGETPARFDEMLEVLYRLPLTYLHVFPYSDRPGTAASALPDKVHGLDVRRRAHEIRAIGERKASAFRQSQVGRVMRALTVDDGRSVVTGNFLKLQLDAAIARNEWVEVLVLDERRATVAAPDGRRGSGGLLAHEEGHLLPC